MVPWREQQRTLHSVEMGYMWQCPGGTLLWCTALRYSGDGLHVAVSRGNTVVVYSTEVQWRWAACGSVQGEHCCGVQH